MGSIGAPSDQTKTQLIRELSTKSTNAYQKVTRNESEINQDSSMHQTMMPLDRPGGIWRSFPDFPLENHQDNMPRYHHKRKKSLDHQQDHGDLVMNPKKKISEKRYRRHAKPPYSYVGLIALAIQSSSTKQLKLSEILARISTMFPFFKGEYQGWRDSVRHNLSQNKCFKKVLPDPKRPQSKGNFWTVNIDEIPSEKLKRQNTPVARNVAPGFTYARDLTDIFDLKTGQLRKTKDQNNVNTISAICGGTFAQNSPESCTSDEFESMVDSSHSFEKAAMLQTAEENSGYNNPFSTSHCTINSPNLISNHQEMSPESTHLFGVASPMTSSSSSSAPHTPSSVNSDVQIGLLHYNNGYHNVQKSSPQRSKVQTKSNKDKVEDELPPPNVAPFGESKRPKPGKVDGRPTPPTTPETMNIDYSFGPIGPPNVNLTSCDDLAKLPASQRNNEILDQYNFIKEQSEILGGRNASNNNNATVDVNNNHHQTLPAFTDLNPTHSGSHFIAPNLTVPSCYGALKPYPQNKAPNFYYNFLPTPPMMLPTPPLSANNPFLAHHLLPQPRNTQQSGFYS